VIDLFQSTVDLQISFALHRFIVTGYLVYIRKPNVFEVVASPIVPKYKNAATDGEVVNVAG